MNVKEISKIKPMKYKYETHLHTKPVSKCAGADVRDSLEFYKEKTINMSNFIMCVLFAV
ncbi:MAG: hypothetical protein IJT23_04840 [Clostridia bacterium]|nr:hypothetical protein [Clostridia bacterium]